MLFVVGGVLIVSGALGLLALYATTTADLDRGYSGFILIVQSLSVVSVACFVARAFLRIHRAIRIHYADSSLRLCHTWLPTMVAAGFYGPLLAVINTCIPKRFLHFKDVVDVAIDPWLSASSWLYSSSFALVGMGLSIASIACIPNLLIHAPTRTPTRACVRCKHCLTPRQTTCPECGLTSATRPANFL